GVGLADLPRLLVGQAELVSHSLKPIRHGLAQLLEIRTETSLFLCPDHVDRTQRQGGERKSAQQLPSHAHNTTLLERGVDQRRLPVAQAWVKRIPIASARMRVTQTHPRSK